MYKVLIVEDEKVIADTLAAHLNKWGYEAVCVTDFQNVLEEFEREKPHIVLMDIGCPFLMGITGVPRLELSLRCLLYFYLQCRTI